MVQLISENTLKDFSLLDNNLSWGYIQPTLKYVQDLKMTELLGRDMYNDIMKEVRDNNVSEKYKTILDDYIRYVLLWGIMSHIQIPLNYKFRNQGMTQNENQDGRVQYLSEIQYTKEFYINTASFYEKELLNFLKNNRSTYTLWKCITKTFNCPITL